MNMDGPTGINRCYSHGVWRQGVPIEIYEGKKMDVCPVCGGGMLFYEDVTPELWEKRKRDFRSEWYKVFSRGIRNPSILERLVAYFHHRKLVSCDHEWTRLWGIEDGYTWCEEGYPLMAIYGRVRFPFGDEHLEYKVFEMFKSYMNVLDLCIRCGKVAADHVHYDGGMP